MSDFTHLDKDNQPQMVDVGQKTPSLRTAIAESRVKLGKGIMQKLVNNELHLAKGPVFQTAIIAGIMGAKKTAELIPMCHPIGLDNCTISIEQLDAESIVIKATTSLIAKTGVEMEALTAASVAALSVYDMCKALSKNIEITSTRLIKKTGGKSDFQMS